MNREDPNQSPMKPLDGTKVYSLEFRGSFPLIKNKDLTHSTPDRFTGFGKRSMIMVQYGNLS